MLAARLLRVIFAFYFSAALLVTCVQLALEYSNERAKLHAEIDAAVQLIQPVLSKTLWDYDKTGTMATLEGLGRNPSLSGIRLEGDIPIELGWTAARAGSDSAGGGLSRLYEQRFAIGRPASEGQGDAVAVLWVYSSSATVLHRSFGVLATVVACALVKTLALWLILSWAIRRMVARPLIRLADGLNCMKGEQGAALDGTHGQGAPSVDELTFALRSFARLRRALRSSRHALLAHQRDLEGKVERRTRELQHQAMHDELTGLLNRRAFETAFTGLMSRRAASDPPGVLCLLDLDHFKLVNDSFGHAAGDIVLRQVAEILCRNTRAGDVVARMGGDEFAVILPDCTVSEAQAKMKVLEREVHGLLMDQDGKRVRIGLSAGLVALSPGSGAEPGHAMADADAACYAAKQAGRHQARVFCGGNMSLRRKADINWVNVIHLALGEDRLLLYAQTIHASSDGRPHRIEVLVRMLLDGRIVTPDHFIPAAERHGLMVKIDEWVVSRTLAMLASNPGAFGRLDAVHVNLSAAAICDPAFYRFVVHQLRLHRVPPAKLCFEITESAAIAQLDSAVRIMTGLRDRGVRFALDDFGHGMSSYTYLQTLPVDCVKIDGSFVRRMGKDAVSRAIVTSINDIAHLAGMSTVAEFVEDEGCFRQLAEIGVDYQQGYHLGRPVPMAEAIAAADLRDALAVT